MLKGIQLENSIRPIVRVLSVVELEDIEDNPISEFILINDYTDPPEVESYMTINYPVYDKVNQKFKWLQIKYQYTSTNELLEIENLKAENRVLNENISTLTEALADIIGGAL